jgi:superfamily I DNA/RNA helicase/RecB family exonuclease
MFELNEAQAAALAADGNVLVDAGPGTGKTQLIATKVAQLVESGVDSRHLLVLTFSRRAAIQLKRRLGETSGAACEVRTFHGFASRLLEAGGPRFKTRRLLSAFADALVFDRALRTTPVATFDSMTRMSEHFRIDAERFASDLRRNQFADVTRLRGNATARLQDLIGIADTAAEGRQRLRASDLNDLIARAVESLSDPASVPSRWLAGRYTHLLIDEFQDIDRLQLTMCEKIGATVFAVGDPAQSIYRFRGAVHGIFDEGKSRLKLRQFALTESRRCPQAICELAAATPLLNATPLKSAAGRDGSIEVRFARTTLDEASLIADRIEDALEDGVEAERIAVLVRSMRPLGTAVVAELAARRIDVATSGREAFFADENVNVMRLALRALAQPNEPSRWVAFFSAPCLGYDVTSLRIRAATAKLDSLDRVLTFLEHSGLEGSVEIVGLCASLRAAADCFEQGDLRNATRRIVSGLGLLERAVKDDDAARARVSIGRLTKLMDSLAEGQRAMSALGAAASSASIVARIHEYADTLGADETPDDETHGVRVLSIHAAKGLEFDFVVIGDAVEGRLPAAARPSTLLDDDDKAALLEAGVDCVDGRGDEGLIEEASLWYVAVTRTRDLLLITYAAQGSDGTPQRVSRFVPSTGDENIKPYERSHERFELQFAGSDDPHARHILENLATESPILAALQNDGAEAFAALENRPVIVPGNLSVSAASTWVECPRRFYYQYALGLQRESSTEARRGTAMHAVLAQFHEQFTTFDHDSVSALPLWRERLRALREAVWSRSNFEADAVRDATAALADRQLGRYAEALAIEAETRPFTVVATERDIYVKFPSGSLRGRVDRIDRLADGSLIVRDYKTGKRRAFFLRALQKSFKDGAPGPGAFDPSLRPQLALYRNGVEATIGAPVSTLEFIYLKGANDEVAIARDSMTINEVNRPMLDAFNEIVDREFVSGFAIGAEVPMTRDEGACRFCEFGLRRLCPGADA